ncbi:MAG: uracil-DNA glycosylase family protein [Bacteroidales bacterium]|nr:uracil-DNA glycosylase family protein [Bacteroidales bacterium]
MKAPLETHPWPPFTPPDAKVLIMGTFPPAAVRWSMDFYYPNRINDFWRIMGMIFFDNRDHFLLPDMRSFNLPQIKQFLTDKGIALGDTGHCVRRLKGNASDKFLEIVTPVDLAALLERMPQCQVVATTGEKAAGVVAELTSTTLPRMGGMVTTQWPDSRTLTITRMPSTSRAYPLAIAKKADYYRLLMEAAGIIC